MPDAKGLRRGLLLCLTYYLPNVSGMTLSAAALARHFAERGHPVTVLSACRPGEAARQYLDDVKVVRTPMAGRVGKAAILPLFPIHVWRALDDVDVVGIHLPNVDAATAAILARVRGRRIILSYACSLSRETMADRLARVAVSIPHLIAGLLADRIQVVSMDYAAASTFCRLFRHKLAFAPPPVPALLEHLDAEGSRSAKQGKNLRAFRVGFVGRLARQKSLGVLLAAFNGLRDRVGREVVLDLAGPTEGIIGEEDWRQTMSTAGQSGGSIRHHGVLHGRTLADFYASLDVLVLPSLSRQESFGLVQVEAMAHGVPVVASDLPGMREPVLQTGMGLLFEPGNSDSLRDAITAILIEGPRTTAGADSLLAHFGPETACRPYQELLGQ